ncbi:DNA-processing protein DprA [Riemerella columbina]|uniref:DNA-processing protein DprA n=1 Tax=Riemerella columbina TaxID=103810 RepID=UPI00266FB8AE|nr:DNA-processing protein DprA [Riemerella columbina]WKS95357.1 DNA-processing protein DprA [Riemerella columbina]
MDAEEILYAIALRKSPSVGDVVFNTLVDAVGSAKEVWHLSKNHLRGISGIGKTIAEHIGNEKWLRFAEQELQFCEQHQIKIRLRHLGELPPLLNECYGAPAILFQKGNYDETATNISIVGTRNATAYGKAFIKDLMEALKSKNIQIISGLALGTDGTAHQEALSVQLKTSAVLAHGLHTLYPSKHRQLAQNIIDHGGALFSEFTTDKKPDREHFLQRNRIVAGLSQATIVVESAYAGGSMSTVTFANQYNREVYALPGKINDLYSQGCNRVIFQNKAKNICDIPSLLEDLGLGNQPPRLRELFPKPLPELNEQQKSVYEIIKNKPQTSLDELAAQLHQNPVKLLPILLDLEILGVISTHSGRQYSTVL